MSDLTPFITALEAAQKKEKYSTEVQDAATGIDPATLKAAVEAALAMGETDKLDDASQASALAAGLEFAAKLVMMLQTAPGPFEKKDLWVYFKIGKGVVPEKPGMFDMVVCFFSSSIPFDFWWLFANSGVLLGCRRSSCMALGRVLSITVIRRLRRFTSSG